MCDGCSAQRHRKPTRLAGGGDQPKAGQGMSRRNVSNWVKEQRKQEKRKLRDAMKADLLLPPLPTALFC